jgi:Domain of Unknown Function (DUF1080)
MGAIGGALALRAKPQATERLSARRTRERQFALSHHDAAQGRAEQEASARVPGSTSSVAVSLSGARRRAPNNGAMRLGGVLWYAAAVFEDFVLRAEWRITRAEDNSGIFLRCPPLEDDPQPAIERGYEVQIDDQGLDPETGRLGSALHLTGAIYRLAPAMGRSSRPVGEWNAFEVTARGAIIAVQLNGTEVSRLKGASREPRGHIGLQNHHDGSAVQFRRLEIMCP